MVYGVSVHQTIAANVFLCHARPSAEAPPRLDAAPPTPHFGHVPALDGIRGLAILWVMLFHMGVIPVIGSAAALWRALSERGGLGVDIFFVLSGFLITGILLDTRESPRYFRNFYARRVLRIFPLYYAIVFFSLVILPHATQFRAAKFEPALRDAPWYWLHLSNFAIARRGAFVHGILDVSWSLAIEEQFYLVWPLVVLLSSAGRLRRVCVALVVLSCASRLALTLSGINPVAVYTLTFCRLDGLAVGALTTLCIRSLDPMELRRLLPGVAIATSTLAAITFAPIQSHLFILFNVGIQHTAVALATACAILGALTSASRALVWVLSSGPLRTLGRYSYAMYLFHYPLVAGLRDRVLAPLRMPVIAGSSLPSQVAFDLVATLATLFVAIASWHAYEKWFLRLKRFF